MMPKWQNFIGKKPINNPKWPSTQAQVDLRITEVWNLLIQWYSRFEIVSTVKEKYSISPQQVDKYIKTAKERIREKNDENLDDDIALTDIMISDVYRSAKEEKKWNSVLRALKLRMELKWLQVARRIYSPSWPSIREEDLTIFWDIGLTEEEKQLARDITWLSE